MFGSIDILAKQVKTLSDGTFILATHIGDPAHNDLTQGYIILTHIKIKSYQFEQDVKAPRQPNVYGFDYANVDAAIPSFKVLATKILPVEDYDETVLDQFSTMTQLTIEHAQ